jgi:NAD(P)-dependent dehydrogenase (short-subunit alcohol dehydrogenase family)
MTTPRIVITGISRGIGRALALQLAAEGACIGGIHRSSDPAVTDELVSAIRTAGGEAIIHVGDTRSTKAIDSLADEVAAAWGGIDGWVNNAARLLVKPFLDMDDADWGDLLDSNLMGYIRGSRAAARHMVRAGAGTIVNIGSAVETFPPTQMTAYVTAKGGITGLTRSLAVELGPHGITVNAVAPGATETPLNTDSWTEEVRGTYRERIPLRRIANAEDIASAIALVLSPGAGYITGQVINVDGGLTLNGSVGHKDS